MASVLSRVGVGGGASRRRGRVGGTSRRGASAGSGGGGTSRRGARAGGGGGGTNRLAGGWSSRRGGCREIGASIGAGWTRCDFGNGADTPAEGIRRADPAAVGIPPGDGNLLIARGGRCEARGQGTTGHVVVDVEGRPRCISPDRHGREAR